MNKQDITTYSDQELSLIVFNTEWLYNMRHSSDLKACLDESYIYTDDQYTELMADLEDDEL